MQMAYNNLQFDHVVASWIFKSKGELTQPTQMMIVVLPNFETTTPPAMLPRANAKLKANICTPANVAELPRTWKYRGRKNAPAKSAIEWRNMVDRRIAVVRVLKSRGGITGDRVVRISFIPPHTRSTPPIVRSEIVPAFDPFIVFPARRNVANLSERPLDPNRRLNETYSHSDLGLDRPIYTQHPQLSGKAR